MGRLMEVGRRSARALEKTGCVYGLFDRWEWWGAEDVFQHSRGDGHAFADRLGSCLNAKNKKRLLFDEKSLAESSRNVPEMSRFVGSTLLSDGERCDSALPNP